MDAQRVMARRAVPVRSAGFIVLVLLPALLGSCAGGGSGVLPGDTDSEPISVPDGAWGGDQIMVQTRDDGAVLEYDCAHGTIDGPLLLDRQGVFHAAGVHVPEGAGPGREDGKPTSRPASYTGRVEGDTIILTVTLTDTEEEIGTFTVVRDRVARITKCL